MLMVLFHRNRAPGLRALLVLIVLSGLCGTAVADDALDRYNLAVGLYKQERWELAAESFGRFVELYPDDPKAATARLYRGLALINDKKYEPARTVLREFVAAHPETEELPSAMYRVAEASYLLDDLRSAEKEFAAFLQKFPEHALEEWALPYLGDTLLRLGKAEAAAERFRASLDRFPRGAMAEDSRFGLAKSLEASGDRGGAEGLYAQLAAKASSPFAAQSQMNLATILFDTGRYAEAAQAFAAVDERFPTSGVAPAARLNAGYALYRAGDFQRAADQFERAAGEQSQRATARYWQAISLKALGEYARAAGLLKELTSERLEGKLAESVRYQWADCELRAGEYETAERLFLEVVQKWPQSDVADDSLHFATEAALLAAGEMTDETARERKLAEAEQLLERFEQSYPDSDLALHQELLRGRVLEARGGEANRTKAVAHFERVLEESTIPRTQSLARFHLARTQQRLGRHAEAVETIAPLVREAEQEGASSGLAEALVLQGNSLLELKRDAEAIAVMTRYLELRPNGDEADQALAARALAAARQGDAETARGDLKTLEERFARSPLYPQTTHAIAELAYEAENFSRSKELFETLVKLGAESSYYPVGLSGLAWSQYRLGEFEAAAATFGRFVREFPQDKERVAEAAYMHGQALQQAGRVDEAIAAYADAFKAFAPERPAGPGAEQERPDRFAYLSGLQLARVEREQGDVEAADAAYGRLLEKFPKPARGDYLLDEWALLHYESENFEKADELFRRLTKEYPESDRADDARLNLAESDYIAARIDAAEREFRALESSPNSDELVRERALFQLIEINSERQRWEDVQKLAAKFGEAYPKSPHWWSAQFRGAEADLALGNLERARNTLLELKSQRDEQAVAEAQWLPRVWVLVAEAYLRLKKYDEVVATVEEFREEFENSPVMHQAMEVLGRSYKNRPMPDFAKAREAFQAVLDDPAARATETAAKSQLMIAETYWLQKEYEKAQEAYLKVYHLYDFPQWQAPALFQAAACDEQLNQWSKAAKAYEELLQKFPGSEMASKAETRLRLARQKASAG